MTALIILHLLQDMPRDSVLGFGLTKCYIWTAVSAPSDKPYTSLPQSTLPDLYSGLNTNTQPFFCQKADQVACFFWNKAKNFLHLLNPGFKLHSTSIIKNTKTIMSQPPQNFFTNPYSGSALPLYPGNKEASTTVSTYWVTPLSSGRVFEGKWSCPLPTCELQ